MAWQLKLWMINFCLENVEAFGQVSIEVDISLSDPVDWRSWVTYCVLIIIVIIPTESNDMFKYE